MIPREILKKIRQIELRTKRIATGFAPGARLCEPQPFRLSEGVENSGRVFQVAAAAGRRPALRSFQPSPHITSKNQLVFWPALTWVLSPGRGFQPVTLSANSTVSPTNPAAGFSKDAENVSPSPWGEGRDEGGQSCLNLTTDRLPRSNYRNGNSSICRESLNYWHIMAWNHVAERWDGLADHREQVAVDRDQVADHRDRIADGADQVAEHRERVADRRERLANDRDAVADDTNRVANHRERLADDADQVADWRERVAERAARVAAHREQLADGRDRIADHRAENADGWNWFAERSHRTPSIASRWAGRSARFAPARFQIGEDRVHSAIHPPVTSFV